MTRFVLALCVLIFVAACSPSDEVKSVPTITSFTATPDTLEVPADVSLEWNVVGASSLSINQGIGAVTPTDKGSKSVNVSTTQSFVLTASNTEGSVNQEVTVTVAPFLSISPDSRAFIAGSVGASFDATLNGSSETITWSLIGPGTLSEATGPSVIYTPPPTVAMMTTATLTATAGTLSSNAAISVAPTVLSSGILFYKSDGSGDVMMLGADGTLTPIKTLNAGDLPSNVTQAAKPYDLYELLYSSDGSGALGSFDGAGNFRRLRSYAAGALPANQSHVISLADRLVFYNAGTSLCGSYSSSNYDFSNPKTQEGFAPDWNLIIRTSGNGVFFYRQADGVGGYGSFDTNCQWKNLQSYSGFTWNWSHLVSTPQGVLFYRAVDGIGALVQFASDGTYTQIGTYVAGELRTDWEHVINTSAGMLFYKGDGSGELGTFDAANTYLSIKSYAPGELPISDLMMPIGN